LILFFAILLQAFVSLSIASVPLSHDFTSMVKNADFPLQIKGFSCFTASSFHPFSFSLKMFSRESPPLHRPPVL